MNSPSPTPGEQTSQKEVRVLAVGILLILLVGIYFFGRAFWQNQQRDSTDYQNLVGESQEATYPTITSESLQKMMATPGEKFTIIDVRPREAYALSHLPNALSYPNEDITTITLPATKIIIIGSETDENLNNVLAGYLTEKDVNFAFLKGGHSTWSASNNQVVTTGNPSSFVDQSKIKYISTDDLKKRFQAGENIFVLDVQSPENFRRKHLTGAVNIPINELEGRIGELPSGQKIIVYGTSEAEAFQAGVILFDLNIFGAEVVTGEQILESGLFTEGQ